MGFTEVVFETFEMLVNQSNLSTIKQLCKQHLFEYDSRIELTKKILNKKVKIPLFVNDSLILIPTQSPRRYDTIWINYCAIRHIYSKGNQTVVVFKNLKELTINILCKSLYRAITQCENVVKYLNKSLQEQISFMTQ